MTINKGNIPAAKLNIDMSQTTPVKCDKCGAEVFVEGVVLRKASKILIGSDQDGLIPIPVFCCGVCGNINENMRPKL